LIFYVKVDTGDVLDIFCPGQEFERGQGFYALDGVFERGLFQLQGYSCSCQFRGVGFLCPGITGCEADYGCQAQCQEAGQGAGEEDGQDMGVPEMAANS